MIVQAFSSDNDNQFVFFISKGSVFREEYRTLFLFTQLVYGFNFVVVQKLRQSKYLFQNGLW